MTCSCDKLDSGNLSRFQWIRLVRIIFEVLINELELNIHRYHWLYIDLLHIQEEVCLRSIEIVVLVDHIEC